jgi:Dolichyl-phosphate-mannose-protein mannosyltransferase
MYIFTLRALLMEWQFWVLEAQFVFLLVTTIIQARQLSIRRSTLIGGCLLGVCACVLTAALPPRTNRIYYDEQIYQSVGRNLSDLHRAQMCNEGIVEYGRLQCTHGEYNKEPYGYPYLLSLVYRVAGAGDTAAFRFNNVVAGLAVLITVVLADLLFGDARIALLSGFVLGLLPMQLQWSNTAASEPTAALLCAASMVAAVHFTRTRTTSALVWTIAVASLTMTTRPECVLIAPLIAVTVFVLSPDEFRTKRLWLGALAGLVASSVSILHMIAVQNEGWGVVSEVPFSWHHAVRNLPINARFFLWDERFPTLCGLAAAIGAAAAGPLRPRAVLVAYFLAFWTIFVFFYAGSYNYGADVRYSLMADVPVAILAAAGLLWIGKVVSASLRRQWIDWQIFAATAAVVLAQFLWYAPLVRATGEEAWGARADVKYAKEFAARLPPNSLVLTHNPGMFHLWNINAAQMSVARTDPRHAQQLFSRFAGGVYLHWNFWCNVSDPVQTGFCRSALDGYEHELVDSRRERTYEYALYRLHGPVLPQIPDVPK